MAVEVVAVPGRHAEPGGDVRRICDLFGLTIAGAARYASVLNHPELDHA